MDGSVLPLVLPFGVFTAVYLLLYWIVVVKGRAIPFKGVWDSTQHWQWYTGEGISFLFCCYMTKVEPPQPGFYTREDREEVRRYIADPSNHIDDSQTIGLAAGQNPLEFFQPYKGGQVCV